MTHTFSYSVFTIKPIPLTVQVLRCVQRRMLHLFIQPFHHLMKEADVFIVAEDSSVAGGTFLNDIKLLYWEYSEYLVVM